MILLPKQTKQMKDLYRKMIIENAIKKGYSINKTQSILKKTHLGIRKQSLQAKFRYEKKTEIKHFAKKYTPKKYRKAGISYQPQLIKEKVENLYRNSWTIKGVPCHSKVNKPIYFGFLIHGFSLNKNILEYNKPYMKNRLIEEMKRYLMSENYASDLRIEISYEYPTEIIMNKSVIDYWILKVEKNGSVINEESGKLY